MLYLVFESFLDDSQFEIQVTFPYEDQIKLKKMDG